MRSRDILIGAGVALSLTACSQEEIPQPNEMFTQELPRSVAQFEHAVGKVILGSREGTAISFTDEDKQITVTAKHVVENCRDGELISQDGEIIITPTFPKQSGKDLAVLASSSNGKEILPKIAQKLPKANEVGYFMTYQEDNGIARGPEQDAPYDTPATYKGIVAQSTPQVVTYIVPTEFGSYQEFEGASGAAVFSKEGNVTSIISKASLVPRNAADINSELGISLEDGHYNVIKATPITKDVLDMSEFTYTSTEC